MTDQEINIAIAEACGWWGNEQDGMMRPPLLNADYIKVPSYTSDLNAMREAEETLLDSGLGTLYGEKLLIVRCHPEPSMARGWDIWLGATATALQRAEAFLRTIRKWREE